MLNRGLFADINGCISTGKEANVYHATAGPLGLSMLAGRAPPSLLTSDGPDYGPPRGASAAAGAAGAAAATPSASAGAEAPAAAAALVPAPEASPSGRLGGDAFAASSLSGGKDLAIKIYKTSILVFKDRDRWAKAPQGHRGTLPPLPFKRPPTPTSAPNRPL
jgi:serine/threonine-protein kinase RIO1